MKNIIQTLNRRPKKGATTKELMAATGDPVPIVNATLNTLKETGLAHFQKVPRPAGARGRCEYRWFPVSPDADAEQE